MQEPGFPWKRIGVAVLLLFAIAGSVMGLTFASVFWALWNLEPNAEGLVLLPGSDQWRAAPSPWPPFGGALAGFLLSALAWTGRKRLQRGPTIKPLVRPVVFRKDLPTFEPSPGDFQDFREVAHQVLHDSPTERALEDNWNRKLRPALFLFRNIRRNLRLAWRFRLRPLHRGNLELRVEPGKVPDCANCQDTCCSGPENTISLRLEDMARLLDAGLDWAMLTEKPAYSAQLLERYPSLREIQRLETFRAFPVLARKADGSCVFLDPEMRCSIYPIRPVRCRRFPYRLDEAFKGIDYSTGCQFPRTDGSPEQMESIAESVVENYNAKIHDLLALEYGWQGLEDLDLTRFLTPENPKSKHQA